MYAAAAAAGIRAVGSLRQENKRCAGSTEADYIVHLVQVVHRHGARTPVHVSPSMPLVGSEKWNVMWGQCKAAPAILTSQTAADHSTSSSLTAEGDPALSSASDENIYSSCGKGQLTRLGEKELRSLGEFLRQRYGSRLLDPDRVGKDALEVTSTPTSRTVLSARSLLKGLFPTWTEEKINESVQVPYNMGTEIMYPNFGRCPRLRRHFHHAKEKAHADSTCKDALERYKRFYASEGIVNKSSVALGDPLWAMQGHGHPLPAEVEKIAAELKKCGHHYLDLVFGSRAHNQLLSTISVRRLGTGLFYTNVCHRITAVVEGRSPLRLAIHSAHDTSIHSLLAAIDFPLDKWPDFASSVVFELLQHSQSSSWHVNVIFYDGLPDLNRPTFARMMPISDWHALLGPILVNETDYVKECQLPSFIPLPPPANW